MAFKLKTGKTVNKLLAGAGIVALGTTILGMVAPQFANSTVSKVLLPAISYGVGGGEAAGRAGAPPHGAMGSNMQVIYIESWKEKPTTFIKHFIAFSPSGLV